MAAYREGKDNERKRETQGKTKCRETSWTDEKGQKEKGGKAG